MALSLGDGQRIHGHAIRVLLVEDNENDFIRTRDTFAEISGVWFALDWESTHAAGLNAIAKKTHDLYLFDYQLGDHTALDLLKMTQSLSCDPVIIMLTGQEDREIDLQAIRSGASDYVIKATLSVSGLDRTIRYAFERKRLRLERDQVTAQLVQTSRRIGMANVASSVLHNVGNVLNSVNISVEVVASTISQSSLGNVARTATMLEEHHHDVGAFLTDDPKGRLIPQYLTKLGNQLSMEQMMLLKEVEHLQQNVEHIKQIISAQQSLAGSGGVVEPTVMAELIEQAVALAFSPTDYDWIEIVRLYQDLPSTILLDKHQVLQILINLVVNAIESMKDTPRNSHVLTIRLASIEVDTSMLRVSVSDTGEGISSEDLSRIFTQGFTTKLRGHGFGLHSAMLSAKSMQGTMSVYSDGKGRGATFTLDLPCRMEAVPV